MKKRLILLILALSLWVSMLTGCGAEPQPYLPPTELEITEIEEEAVALAEAPPAVTLEMVTQRGSLHKGNQRAEIDYSNTAEGYVMALVRKDSGKRWKAQVKGPTTTYTYNMTPETWAVFPLSDGSGSYQITVYENVSGKSYAAVVSQSCKVELKDEFRPFLYANQYVDHASAPNAVAKAAELTANCATELEKVAAVYDFVVSELSYDRELASTVQSGYLPVLDNVLTVKKGICFDYAALMTGMLRSQGVPCKLVVGYAGTAYHAWINVWTEEQGWIDQVVFFDGAAWQRMDPTFASSSNRDPAVAKFIGDGQNYTAKYFY